MSINRKNQKIIGRPQEIEREELVTRYKEMKAFLENNWGRLGLEITRVRTPEAVRLLFKRVPNVEWCKPFQGHAICLIAESMIEATSEEVRQTRRQWKEAEDLERNLWSEYHAVAQQAQQAVTAVKAVMAEFQDAQGTAFFFFLVNAIVAGLGVDELTRRSSQLLAAVRKKHEGNELLTKDLRA